MSPDFARYPLKGKISPGWGPLPTCILAIRQTELLFCPYHSAFGFPWPWLNCHLDLSLPTAYPFVKIVLRGSFQRLHPLFCSVWPVLPLDRWESDASRVPQAESGKNSGLLISRVILFLLPIWWDIFARTVSSSGTILCFDLKSPDFIFIWNCSL